VRLGGLPTFVPHVLEMFKIHFLLEKMKMNLYLRNQKKIMFFITARRFELFNFHGKIYGNVNLEKFIE
jgi:hypothetical protein